MPAHVRVVPCQRKQVIEKFVRSVPCPQAKPKKKAREVPCSEMECRKTSNHTEEVIPCPEPGYKNVLNGQKKAHKIVCPAKQQEKCVRHVQKVQCPGEQKKPRGCPKCENNRIDRLECEVRGCCIFF